MSWFATLTAFVRSDYCGTTNIINGLRLFCADVSSSVQHMQMLLVVDQTLFVLHKLQEFDWACCTTCSGVEGNPQSASLHVRHAVKLSAQRHYPQTSHSGKNWSSIKMLEFPAALGQEITAESFVVFEGWIVRVVRDWNVSDLLVSLHSEATVFTQALDDTICCDLHSDLQNRAFRFSLL